MCFRCLYF